MKATPLINNFTSGEWSPLLEGRSDLLQYSHSAEIIQNVLVLPYGGVTKIPGTRFVTPTKDNDKARLIPFEFNVTQAYIVEFGDEYLRFYMNHGQIESGGNPYEVASPYLDRDLPYLQFAQEADVMYLTHSSYPPKRLCRFGHTNWVLYNYIPQKGPLLPENTISGNTITPSSDTGNGITLVAVNPIFDEGHVGNFVWRVKEGYVKITGFTDTKNVTANVMYGGDLGTGPGATADWAEAAWSAYRGYPAAVTLHEQRLFFAYSSYKPQTIWGTVSGNYELMELGSEDDSALRYTLATTQVILWILGDVVLFVGTSGGLFNLSSGEESHPLTPTNIVVRKQTNFGCNTVLPVKMGNYLYYVQRNNKTLREYDYEYSSDRFLATDVTLLAEHVLKPGVVEIAYQQSPYNLLYAIRSNGEVSIFTRNAIQDVLGWARLPGSGKAESVAVIPRPTGDDEVWFIYERTVGGETKRYIEYLEDFSFETLADSFFVRSGLSYSGEPVSTVSGLDHLVGEEVAILGDGAVFPRAVVNESGEVTLSSACSKIHVGLHYEVLLRLQKLEAGSALGTAQMKVQRFTKLAIKFYRSLGCLFGTQSKKDVLPFRSTSMDMDKPPDLFSGDRIVTFPKGYARDIKIEIYQDQPLPLTILSMVAFGETYES